MLSDILAISYRSKFSTLGTHSVKFTENRISFFVDVSTLMKDLYW
jgi:hypothetical protein